MSAKRQRGAALILTLVGLVALLAMVGLAIDVGHLTLNKARLQSTVDAVALAAAKKLDQTGSEAQATAAAQAVLGFNANEHPELKSVMGSLKVVIQYSATLQPFAPGTAPANYVRVSVSNFSMWNSFTSLVGVTQIDTGASAVAGPSPRVQQACNIAPMVVCGDPKSSAQNNWGYNVNDLTVLKTAAGTNPGSIGPGNFQLLNLGGNGANIVRKNLAGGYGECADVGKSVNTEPGVAAGPVTQGLNTRFGDYAANLSPADYPSDVVITEPTPKLDYNTTTGAITQNGKVVTAGQIYNHDNYLADTANSTRSGVPLRRELAVPIADCTGKNSGDSDLPVVGFACYFLLQRATQKGNDNYIYGQFLGSCNSGGVAGPDPNSGPGPYVIQLYNDVQSGDS